MNPGQDDSDEDMIDLSLDSLNWPPSAPSAGGFSGGSSIWGSSGGGLSIPAGGVSGSAGGVSSGGVGGLLSPGQLSMNFSIGNPTVKTDVEYIVVPETGDCLEMWEQTPITPREIIGLAKFVNMVTMYMNSTNIKMKWSEVIESLGIERHFTPGLSNMHQYNMDTETLYVFLIDDT